MGTDDLPPIAWQADSGALTWKLLALLQKQENFIVLYGKKDPKENTSADSKNAVYERIAASLFPEDSKKHAKNLGKRVKGKAESLVKTYKEKATRLRVTGGGVGDPGEAQAAGGHQYLEYDIPPDGPHHDTPIVAKNIWDQLNREFPYFQELHKFLSTRPNVVPPMISTGIGPHGRVVMHNQVLNAPAGSQVPGSSFDDSVIDPQLLALSAATPSPPMTVLHVDDRSVRPITTDSRAAAVQTPQTSSTPKNPVGSNPSTFSTDLTNVMEKARQNLQFIPKKRSLEEVIMDASRENLAIARERAAAQAEHRRRTLLLEERKQITRDFELGISSREEVRAALAVIDKALRHPSTPRKSTSARSPTATRRSTPRTPRTPRTFHAPRHLSSSPTPTPYSPTHWEIEDSQALLPDSD